MPWPLRPQLVVGLLLLTALPLQYYLQKQQSLSSRPSTTSASNSKSTTGFKEYLKSWYDWYQDLNEWLDEVLPSEDLFDEEYYYEEEEDEDLYNLQLQLGDTFFHNITNEGWFTTSPKPRRSRPSKVKFRVGQVVLNDYDHTQCVITGWDQELKAPQMWIDAAYGLDQFKYLHEPHYSVICDMRESESIDHVFQYCAQSDLTLIAQHWAGIDLQGSAYSLESPGKVFNPLLNSYFDHFDPTSGTYVMKPKLRRLYPKD